MLIFSIGRENIIIEFERKAVASRNANRLPLDPDMFEPATNQT